MVQLLHKLINYWIIILVWDFKVIRYEKIFFVYNCF